MHITSPRIMAFGILASIGALFAICSDVGLAILIGGLIMTVGSAVTCLIESGLAEDGDRQGYRVVAVVGLLAAGGIALFVIGAGSAGACGGGS